MTNTMLSRYVKRVKSGEVNKNTARLRRVSKSVNLSNFWGVFNLTVLKCCRMHILTFCNFELVFYLSMMLASYIASERATFLAVTSLRSFFALQKRVCFLI